MLRHRPVLTRSWLLVVAGVAVAGCTSTSASPSSGPPTGDRGPVQIMEYRVEGDTVVVVVDTCHGDPTVTTLTEGTERVEVAVVSTRHDPGDSYQDELALDLDGGLGDRELVDLSDGAVVDPPAAG